MNARWNPSSFPFEADYNDHFETPKQSYIDILPLMESIARSLSLTRSNLCVYDPYYCNGQAKVHLHSIGFTDVRHEKRDFYEDMQNNKIPLHHVLCTNPPYSDNHKERIVEYAVTRLRTQNIPFFMLMPNYVAIKEYFRNAIKKKNATNEEDPLDIFYVLPATKYQYNHPEGTGKTESPFDSIWYCGLPESMVSAAIDSFHTYHGHNGHIPRLARSIDELKLSQAVPTIRRRNPKRRRKAKARIEAHKGKEPLSPKPKKTASTPITDTKNPCTQIKASIYRDEKGIRKKRRF